MRKKIPIAEPDLKGNELKYVTKCIRTNWISSNGSYVPEFGEKFAKYCGVKHGIPVSNGTVALHLALLAFDIGPGDEVLIPGLTFAATANAVLYVGAKPVFLEVDRFNWCLDPKGIEKKISKRTKAIIPVHLYGHPVNMPAIMKIARKYKIFVIEDAAEAHGALVNGKKVGSFGEMSCFSFFGNKTITTGEGGMVVTNDKKLAEKVKYLRDGARDRAVSLYYHAQLGYNYALTNLQAAVGLAQLERINKFISRKRKIAEVYKKTFKGFDKIEFSPEEKWARSTYWMSSIVLTDKSKASRDRLIHRLSEANIETRPFFYPIYKLPYINHKIRLPVVDYLASNGLNLPSGVTLTEKEALYVARTVMNILS